MKKAELLLPAGNEECLRAAVNNGADAVYLGLNRFNARQSAGNFNEENLFSAIDYCHKRNVRVYVALNTLVKDYELEAYFRLMAVAYSAKADAVIIQDPCFIPIIKKNFPGLAIHLSTQAATTNSYSVPEGIDRVILARELSIEEIKEISKKVETEVFVHGALCFSYSGQCLFSSIAGGRSGNRGMCAQPCRRKYNSKYLLSTKDLCLLTNLPEIIETGASCLKVEGRMRTPFYVQTVASIYRKAIDDYYKGKFSFSEKQISQLKLAFNRKFTTGFAFNKSIVDSRKPMNRGLFIGEFKGGKLHLTEGLRIGDGVGIGTGDRIKGFIVLKIIKKGKIVSEASSGDVIELKKGAVDGVPAYKTSSVESVLNLGDEIPLIKTPSSVSKIEIPSFKEKENKDKVRIFVKAYDAESAVSADKANADVVYYDILKEDCLMVKNKVKHAKFFVYTPRILSDKQILEIKDKIDAINPDGVLVGNRGLLKVLEGYELHLDYSFNCFNDIDLNCFKGIPIISLELDFNDVVSLKNKNFIVLVHGDIVLMTTKEKLKPAKLVDEEGRHFRVRGIQDGCEILNEKQIGLFNKAADYAKEGIKYFYIDTAYCVDNFARIYRKILNFEKFDDTGFREGYTTGHFNRGVY